MAVTYGFYNSLNGDRKYNAEQMSAIFDGVITDGVFGSIGGALMTIAGEGMQVLVKTGKAWFNSTWTLNDAQMALPIDTADVSLTRIDAVVLEVNSGISTRENSIKVIKGTPSANPVKPTMASDEDLHQYALAYVTVAANATSITAANIEVNVGKTGCPFVTSVLQQTSITDLFAQWEAEFDTWFDNVQAQLAGDVATNLQLQIDALNSELTTIGDKTTKLSKDYGLKVADLLVTIKPDPGDEFILCNGSNVDIYPGLDLDYSRYTTNISSESILSRRFGPTIAYDGKDTIGVLVDEADSCRIFGITLSSGAVTDTIICKSSSKTPRNLVFYKGYWVATVVQNNALNIYTATAPNAAWDYSYTSSYYNRNSVYMSVINDTLMIVAPHMNSSSSSYGNIYLIYTNDVASGFIEVSTNINGVYNPIEYINAAYCGGLYYISAMTKTASSSYYSSIFYSSSISGPWTEITMDDFYYNVCDMLPIKHNGKDKLTCLVERSSSKYDIMIIDPSDQSISNTVLDIDVGAYRALVLRQYKKGYIILPYENYKILYSDTIEGPYKELSNSPYGSYTSIIGYGDSEFGTMITNKTSTLYLYVIINPSKHRLPSISFDGAYAFLKIKEPEVS